MKLYVATAPARKRRSGHSRLTRSEEFREALKILQTSTLKEGEQISLVVTSEDSLKLGYKTPAMMTRCIRNYFIRVLRETGTSEKYFVSRWETLDGSCAITVLNKGVVAKLPPVQKDASGPRTKWPDIEKLNPQESIAFPLAEMSGIRQRIDTLQRRSSKTFSTRSVGALAVVYRTDPN